MDEENRCRLIADVARMVRDEPLPDETRCACLTLIGWLARRMPGECSSKVGVIELRALLLAIEEDG